MKNCLVSPPEKDICASLQLGGSKSISNRLLILREVLQQDFTINNLSDSEDTQLLVQVFNQLKEGKDLYFNVNHAGTDFRFLTAFLAARPGGPYTLTGSERLKERPIAELVSALKQLGAEIEYLEKDQHPPLRITGKKLKGGKIQLQAGISSQFTSALLLISPLYSSGLELSLKGEVVSMPYINMSLQLLKTNGVPYDFQPGHIKILPYQQKTQSVSAVSVESDWSSASYWYSVCALSQKAKIKLMSFGKNSLQADARLSEIYSSFGVKSVFSDDCLTITNQPPKREAFEYDFTACPDIALTIACTCLGLGIHARLTGLKTLQLKESKRINTLKSELEKFGARVKTSDDVLELTPPQKKPDGSIRIATHHDHRIAMSFAPLAMVFSGVIIEDPDVVNKSYPRFWEDLQSLGFRLNLQS